MVTVIFSHRGSTDSPEVVANAGLAVARISGTIERSTLRSPPAPAPAARLLPPPARPTREFDFGPYAGGTAFFLMAGSRWILWSGENRRRNTDAQRNGGRHCCQPPLRRAKDLPVFVT